MSRTENYEDKRMPQEDPPDIEPQENYYDVMVSNRGFVPIKLTVTARINSDGEYKVVGVESTVKSYQPKFDELDEMYQDEVIQAIEVDATQYKRDCEASDLGADMDGPND